MLLGLRVFFGRAGLAGLGVQRLEIQSVLRSKAANLDTHACTRLPAHAMPTSANTRPARPSPPSWCASAPTAGSSWCSWTTDCTSAWTTHSGGPGAGRGGAGGAGRGARAWGRQFCLLLRFVCVMGLLVEGSLGSRSCGWRADADTSKANSHGSRPRQALNPEPQSPANPKGRVRLAVAQPRLW